MASAVGVVGRTPVVVDLHLHTSASDGDESAQQLADRCVGMGLRIAAVTDHDTMVAVEPFRRAAGGRFAVVPACEITARWHGEESHCLAYWVSGSDTRLAARLRSVHDSQLAWLRQWVGRVRDLGVPLEWDTVEREIGVDRVAAPDDYLALLLRAAGDDTRFRDYAGDTRRLVADLCRSGQPLHVPTPWEPELTDVIGWVAEAGGVSVLAHPARLLASREDPRADVAELAEVGLGGLEVWTTWHTPAQSAHLAGLTARAGLVPTLGSDYHGPRVKPWALAPGLLPAAPGDPLLVIEALERRRPAIARTKPRA